MTLQFCDDFRGYGTNAALMLNGLYANVGDYGALVEDPDPGVSGVCYMLSNGQILRRVLTTPRATIGSAFRVWFASLPSSGTPMLAAMAPDTPFFNSSIALHVTATGVLEVYDTGNNSPYGSLLGTSGSPAITANSWHHIEWKVKGDPAAGTVEVRVDGVTVIMEDSLDTVYTSLNQLIWSDRDRLGAGGIGVASPGIYIKDMIAWDTVGSKNNDFFGTVSVVSMVPNSDVTLGGWTTSHGANGYPLLANSPPVDSTDYIARAATGTPAKFGLADLPVDITSVRALVTQVRAAKIDGGDAAITPSLISSTDKVDGAAHVITTAFAYYEDVFETDPHTDANWSPASANAAVLQIDRTT